MRCLFLSPFASYHKIKFYLVGCRHFYILGRILAAVEIAINVYVHPTTANIFMFNITCNIYLDTYFKKTTEKTLK